MGVARQSRPGPFCAWAGARACSVFAFNLVAAPPLFALRLPSSSKTAPACIRSASVPLACRASASAFRPGQRAAPIRAVAGMGHGKRLRRPGASPTSDLRNRSHRAPQLKRMPCYLPFPVFVSPQSTLLITVLVGDSVSRHGDLEAAAVFIPHVVCLLLFMHKHMLSLSVKQYISFMHAEANTMTNLGARGQ
jgi:hypothetical protein